MKRSSGSKRKSMACLLLALSIWLTVSSASATVSFVSPNVIMSEGDLRQFVILARERDVYKDLSDELSIKLQDEQSGRERDRYIALGLGILIGWMVTK